MHTYYMHTDRYKVDVHMLQTWSRGATTNGCQYKCITYLPSCEAMGWSQAPPRCCNQCWPCKMQSCLMGVTCSPQGVPLLSHPKWKTDRSPTLTHPTYLIDTMMLLVRNRRDSWRSGAVVSSSGGGDSLSRVAWLTELIWTDAFIQVEDGVDMDGTV